MDERFLMHRLKSTSLAAMAGGIGLGVLFFFEFIIRQRFRWDVFIILALMAATKISSMIYLRIKQ